MLKGGEPPIVLNLYLKGRRYVVFGWVAHENGAPWAYVDHVRSGTAGIVADRIPLVESDLIPNAEPQSGDLTYTYRRDLRDD